MLEFIRSYVVLRQREGAFRKADPNTLVMMLGSPAMHYASSKYIFGMKILPGTDKEAAGDFAKLLVAALRPEPSRVTKKTLKKTSKRKI